MTTGYRGISFQPPQPLDPRERLELDQLRALMRELQSKPQRRAVVLEKQPGGKLLIAVGGDVVEIAPSRIDVQVSDMVHVAHTDGGGFAIVDKIDKPAGLGQIETVERVVDDHHVEATRGGGPLVGLCVARPPLPRVGDRVVLDPAGVCVLRNLGPPPETETAPAPTGVRWEDVAGQAEAVAMLREAVEGPIVDREIRALYGKKREAGALLCGPPGCGKTLLGKAAATAYAKLAGDEGGGAATGYRYVKGPEILHELIGRSERQVRDLFDHARRHADRYGYPCVLFIDEGDALLMRRGHGRMEGIERTIVPQFLTEMDGMQKSGAFVIVATNRPEMLDPAVMREGRLDLKIMVKRPSKSDAFDIFRVHLAGVPSRIDGGVAAAAEHAADRLFDKRHVLYVLRSKSGKLDRRVTLGDLSSGAMCADIVMKAAGFAIARDRTKKPERVGILAEDLDASVSRVFDENRLVEHVGDIEAIAIAMGDDFKSMQKTGAR